VADSRYRILVVDDEEPIVDIVCDMIARFGHETLRAFSGKQAVAKAMESHPDAVVTGIMMVDGDGVWEAEQLRTLLPDCKIVFVSSALHNSGIRNDLIAMGFDARIMLVKPFEAAQLAEALTVAGIPSRL